MRAPTQACPYDVGAEAVPVQGSGVGITALDALEAAEVPAEFVAVTVNV